jgi:hypothetical protein
MLQVFFGAMPHWLGIGIIITVKICVSSCSDRSHMMELFTYRTNKNDTKEK